MESAPTQKENDFRDLSLWKQMKREKEEEGEKEGEEEKKGTQS